MNYLKKYSPLFLFFFFAQLIILYLHDNLQSGHSNIRLITFAQQIFSGRGILGTASLAHQWHLLYEFGMGLFFNLSYALGITNFLILSFIYFSIFSSLYFVCLCIYMDQLGFKRWEQVAFSILSIMVFPGMVYQLLLTEDNFGMYFIIILLPLLLKEIDRSFEWKKVLLIASAYGVSLMIQLQGIIFLGMILIGGLLYRGNKIRTKSILAVFLGGFFLHFLFSISFRYLLNYGGDPYNTLANEVFNLRIGYAGAGDSYQFSRLSWNYFFDVLLGVGQFAGGFANPIWFSFGEGISVRNLPALLVLAPFFYGFVGTIIWIFKLKYHKDYLVQLLLIMLVCALSFSSMWETFFHHRWDMFGILFFLLALYVFKKEPRYRYWVFYPFALIQLVWGINEALTTPLRPELRAQFNQFRQWVKTRPDLSKYKGVILRQNFLKFDSYIRTRFIHLSYNVAYDIPSRGNEKLLFPWQTYLIFDHFTEINRLNQENFIGREDFLKNNEYSVYIDPEVLNPTL